VLLLFQPIGVDVLFSGYCQQVDTHVDLATVREALLFSAKLRQPVTVPLLEKEAWFVFPRWQEFLRLTRFVLYLI